MKNQFLICLAAKRKTFGKNAAATAVIAAVLVAVAGCGRQQPQPLTAPTDQIQISGDQTSSAADETTEKENRTTAEPATEEPTTEEPTTEEPTTEEPTTEVPTTVSIPPTTEPSTQYVPHTEGTVTKAHSIGDEDFSQEIPEP